MLTQSFSKFAITTVLAFNGLVYAGPAFSGHPLEITNTRVFVPRKGDIVLEYTVFDPEPLEPVIALCTHTWKAGTQDFGQIKLCNNTAIASKIETYTDARNFTLQINHSFEDPSVGDPPYNQVVTFANATVNSTLMWCVPSPIASVKEYQVCTQRRGSKIEAPIYASIA